MPVRIVKITSLERFRKETVRPLLPEPGPHAKKLTDRRHFFQKPNLQPMHRERPL